MFSYINKKQIFIFLFVLLVVGFLPFLVKEIEKRQLFVKKAYSEYSDEVPSQIPIESLEFEDGILASPKEIDNYLNEKKTKKPLVSDNIIKPKEIGIKEEEGKKIPFAVEVAGGAGGSSGGGGEASRLTLPSISAFSSNLQTGTAQVSYPIAVFPGLGGLTPSVSLVYSSSAVDDMRLYQRVPSYYTTQAGIAGLGWEIGGISYIARDTTTHPDSFYLVFAGGSTRLFKPEGSSEWQSEWQSNPKLFIKVHHVPNNHYQYYDTNTWIITTQDGTRYIFGSPVKSDGTPLDEALTPLTLAKTHPGNCGGGNTTKGTPYKWYLREVKDTNGNTIIYEYDKDWAETYYGACESRGFTTATYLKRIKYNFKNGNYQTTIDFNYEDRPDYQTFDWLRYHRQQCKNSKIWSESDCDKFAGKVQYRVARKRLKEIVVNVTGRQARRYVLNYEMSPGRGTFGQPENPDKWHPGHSLLKEIRQYGTGSESLPPYTFDYSQIGDDDNPNNIYLTRAKNGYGGEVIYEYTLVNPTYCTSDGICGNNGEFGSSRFVVRKIITKDGEGNSFQKSYTYQNPKAYVKTPVDSSAVDYCNQVWRPQCISECERAYPDNPEAQGRCKSRCETAFCGYPQPFTGFEFYGFGQVEETLSALNNPEIIEASTRTYYYQALEKQGCFEPDPRRGRVYKTEILSSDGRVLTYSENFYDPERTDDSCRPDKNQWEKESVFIKLVQTNNIQADPSIGNKVTSTRFYYHDTYGLVTKVENLGEVTLSDPNNHRQINNIPGDESYSFTEYIANNDKWIVKPKETWISDTPEGNTKYQQTIYYYDGNETYSPAPAKNLEKGLLTRISLEDEKTYGSVKKIVTNMEYDECGQLKKTIDPMGYTTETFYDNKIGVFPVAVKNPLGQISRTQYSDHDYLLGLPTISIDIAGRKTKIEYDTFGRVLNVFNPDDNNPTQPESQPSISYQYFDSLGKPYIRIKTKIFEGNYQVVDKIYNGLGQLLQDQVLATFVDERGDGSKSEKGLVSEIKYNSLGKVVETSVPLVVDARLPVNPPTKINLPDYEKTITKYDQLGRVIAVIDPIGRTSRKEYLNFTTVTIDPAGHRLVTESDGLGRIKMTSGYLGNFGQETGKRIITTSTYDVLGNPLTITQSFPDNPELTPVTTTSKYDLLGRKIEVSDPDLGRWAFEYDAKGRLIKQIDAKNQEIRFEYDALDRITKKIYPRKPYLTALRNFIEYKYDDQCGSSNSLGQKCRMDDLTGYTTWEYDKKGRVTKMTKFIDKNIIGGGNSQIAEYTYTYYSTNQIKTYKYPDDEVIVYTYDKYGNQQTMSGIQPYLIDIAVNKFGSPTKITLADDFSQSFSYYNPINQLTNITVKDSQRTLLSIDYTNHDSLGNILSITEKRNNGQTEIINYTYDSLSQLKEVQVTSATSERYSYVYDEAGNMRVKNEDNPITITYSNTHPIHAPKVVNGFAYRYDANGNLLEDEERVYEWDFDNKPIKITMKATGVQILMFYDGDGERIVKKEINTPKTPTITTDKQNLFYESDKEQTAKKEIIAKSTTIVYFPGLEKNLTTGEVNKYYSVGASTIQRNSKNGQEELYYLFSDHLSSTRAIINKDKTKTYYLSYFPYGKLKTTGEVPSSVTNLYTSQKQDRETNLYYYHARYYNPQTGHFISADQAEGPNRYAYVGNNPVMKNDPTGNFGFCSIPMLVAGAYYSRLIGEQLVKTVKESYSLMSSDLPAGYKVLGELDILLGHSLSNTTFAVNKADPFRGGVLSFDSQASVGERAEAFAGVLGNALVLSSQIVGAAEFVGKATSFVSREGALALYSKYGSKELVPAIKYLRKGKYKEAFEAAAEAWKKADESFQGFQFVDFTDPRQGGAGPYLRRGMGPDKIASLAIHEASHEILGEKISRRIIGNTKVTLNNHYGLYAQSLLWDEFFAYLAEYAGGVKGLRAALMDLGFSFGSKTGGVRSGLKAILLER